MARKRPRAYPREFRLKIVALARAGRRPEELATEFQVGRIRVMASQGSGPKAKDHGYIPGIVAPHGLVAPAPPAG